MPRTFTHSQKDQFRDAALEVNLDIEAAIEWISSHCDPEDVFSDKDLEGWARANDFITKDESEDAVEEASRNIGLDNT